MSTSQTPKTKVVEIAETADGPSVARGPRLDPIADVQNKPDIRHIAIDKVGIKDIRHPVLVKDRSQGVQHTIANFNMYVELPHNFKGTHMSRFVEILNSHDMEISVESFKGMLSEMRKRLEAERGHIEMSFPYFINKAAPVSGVKSLMDYQVSFIGEINGSQDKMTIKVVVPVTSLCPCSKEISKYGAHNQRSHVTIAVHANTFVWVEDLIDLVEKQGRCTSLKWTRVICIPAQLRVSAWAWGLTVAGTCHTMARRWIASSSVRSATSRSGPLMSGRPNDRARIRSSVVSA